MIRILQNFRVNSQLKSHNWYKSVQISLNEYKIPSNKQFMFLNKQFKKLTV